MDANNSNLAQIAFSHHRLKAARRYNKLTQQQVANECKITLRQYQRLESGERSLSGTAFRVGMALCDLLNIEPHKLLETPMEE